MICFFSGTGNAKAVAKQLSGLLQETVCFLPPAEKCKKTGRLILVCPVYWYGLPLPVAAFLNRLSNGAGQEAFCVFVYHSGIGRADKQAKKALMQAGYRFVSAYCVPMPDNYVLMLNPQPEAKQQMLLAQAEDRVHTIAEQIKARENGRLHRGAAFLLSPLLYAYYRRHRPVKKFTAERSCVACGLCVRCCPTNTIRPDKNGRPFWQGDDCCRCLACINRCPAQAIQYGKRTKTRRRYVCPKSDMAKAPET